MIGSIKTVIGGAVFRLSALAAGPTSYRIASGNFGKASKSWHVLVRPLARMGEVGGCRRQPGP